MKTPDTKTKIILIAILLAFGVTARLLPHAFNFTPIIAIALFASAYLGVRYSAPLTISIMLASDLFIGFYQWQMVVTVYGSLVLSAVIGHFLKKNSVQTVLVGTLGSSLVFFLITNWAVWQFGTMYERSLSGLMQSYVMALPFFKNSLAGDLFYTAVLFGAMYAVCALSARKTQRNYLRPLIQPNIV